MTQSQQLVLPLGAVYDSLRQLMSDRKYVKNETQGEDIPF